MANYDIYVLQEDDLSISGGGQLDGVTQGDGSHLVGLTLTINAANWQPVSIVDGDSSFGDNDGNQRLDGPATLNDTTYADGTRVEAEYGITVTLDPNDPNSPTWQLVGFNVRDSSPAFGTIEGIAVIGGPGDFPPAGVPLYITAAQEGPNFAAADYATPICFVAGTRISTPQGERPVEELRPGDLVVTRDHGPQPLVWTGRRCFPAFGAAAPVRFETGVIGNRRPLMVSRQHRVPVRGWAAELLTGETEVLVPAQSFLGLPGVSLCEGGFVDFVHVMCDGHRILFAEGAEAESFFPGDTGLATLSDETRQELARLFPDAPTAIARPILPCLTGHEARAVAAQAVI